MKFNIMKLASVLTLSASLFACGTVKVPVATGGSLADAMIEMTFVYGPFETHTVDLEQAAASAAERCKAWRFDTAKAFDEPITNVCLDSYSTGGCGEWRATIKYHCINNN